MSRTGVNEVMTRVVDCGFVAKVVGTENGRERVGVDSPQRDPRDQIAEGAITFVEPAVDGDGVFRYHLFRTFRLSQALVSKTGLQAGLSFHAPSRAAASATRDGASC